MSLTGEAAGRGGRVCTLRPLVAAEQPGPDGGHCVLSSHFLWYTRNAGAQRHHGPVSGLPLRLLYAVQARLPRRLTLPAHRP